MKSPLQRLYATKLALLATVFTVAGLVLLAVAHHPELVPAWGWLWALPLTDIGSALFTTGLIVVAFEYVDSQDADSRAMERLDEVITKKAPAIRDAVIDGFAFAPETLASVASTETLDRVARNALAVQLRDEGLAHDLYEDLLKQAPPDGERRSDMRVSVSLSPAAVGPRTGPDAMFAVTIRREFRVVPKQLARRFACVSTPDEYRELLMDPATTEAYYFESRAGLDAASPNVYELLDFTVNGRPRPVRRATRSGAQVCTVNLADLATAPGEEVQIAYTFRELVQQHGHLLRLDFGAPCKGVAVTLAYGDAGIRYMNVMESIPGAQETEVVRSPKDAPPPTVTVRYDGWVFPRSSIAFCWVLDRELEDRT
ncbi:hypothetical protein I6A60_39160 [Frankia sp. AgB1.9]|uniref:hypothetical protein n=1 Tax=unclassified Frankia TaxID=2632575 RepID=UPI001933FA9F|nr:MULTISPECIES: hypothetical protein [unclassified Frankia]MBL7491554.1 hypothetical protein [Frankia sp. AgW1.1]MBL7553805.1 hypothetical protein [Frankia sp. AgB1.9]MBL7617905.1 hypothetical protein [Frankia sp. AgB1.8]